MPSIKIVEDILWSDPVESEGERPNLRGAGVEFGHAISRLVCQRLGVTWIIRSHQPRKALGGPFAQHNGHVITVYSSSVYGGSPFVLVLPTKHLTKAFTHLETCTYYLDLR